MMLKLYNRASTETLYWECWDNGRKIIVHWGVLGTKGKTRTINLGRGEKAKDIMAVESAVPMQEGFRELEIEAHATIVVQYRTETWGSVEDLNRRHEVEGILNECLGWTGNGHCDGGDIGSGSINAFSAVVDPVLAGQAIIKALRARKLLAEATVAYRLPESDDYIVVWPEDFRGEFSIL